MNVRCSETVVQDQVVDLIPALRALAWTLCRDRDRADDLVQETLLRAMSSLGSYTPGTNLRAWLFTIMRNTHFTRLKRDARMMTGRSACVSETAASPADQEWSRRAGQLFDAIRRLPVHYRTPFVLIAVFGESYRDAAAVCGCRLGTIKSRVNRARAAVIEELGGEL